MKILLVGINYRTAPVDLRECFSVTEAVLAESLQKLNRQAYCQETVILSTCNRTEIYSVVDDLAIGKAKILEFLSNFSKMPEQEFKNHLYIKEGIGAVRHLLHVVTGMDSMIVGETQILGQLKHAFLYAQAQGATGALFNALFNRVIAFGKRVQSETSIGQSAVSVSYAAVALAKKVFDQLHQKSVLVIGAGKMSELTLTHLEAQGVTDVWIANRTLEKAKTMAKKFDGKAMSLDQLYDALVAADIVITSTGSTSILLNVDMMNEAMKRRRSRPMFIIDIAVPRDVDPAVAKISDVYLYDIDDLQEVVSANISLRHQEAMRVEERIEEEIEQLRAWVLEQEAVPLIAELRKKAVQIQNQVLESLYHKLSDLDDHDRKVLQKHTQSIVNQILKSPIANLKAMAAEPDGADQINTFARLFDLDYVPVNDRYRQEQSGEDPTDQVSLKERSLDSDASKHHVNEDRKANLWKDNASMKPLAAL